LNLSVERGESLVLLGKSGSGKTTALRLINRLLEPTAGSIYLDGEDIATLKAVDLRRRIGYVIQEFGLMPHWTVEQNVVLVPSLLGWDEARKRVRAVELLEQVGLRPEEVRNRRPAELSGGQRQRVGVARALAASPALLLFDEPFGALDPVTRAEMQQQFLKLRHQYQVASVFVTHDIAEALTLGNRIAVLEDGHLETVVTPEEFFRVETPMATAFRNTLPPEMIAGRRP
jgi:osmoprotectant transport system ATP-binding protein